MLLETDGISLQDPQVVRAALSAFAASRADFPDCLILAVAESAGMAPAATFDVRFAKLPGTRRLGRKRKEP
jgi:predicted nucleic-acid-binding protein